MDVQESHQRMAMAMPVLVRIQKLKEDGQSTVEAERLLQLMHQSRVSMQRQADHFAKDKT